MPPSWFFVISTKPVGASEKQAVRLFAAHGPAKQTKAEARQSIKSPDQDILSTSTAPTKSTTPTASEIQGLPVNPAMR